MNDRDSAQEPDDLLLFTPVATAYRGANGWSSEVQRAFVAALARCGVVAAAARSVGRSPSSAYQLRRRAGDASPFARAWEEAATRGAEQALDVVVETSIEGRRTPVFYRGRQVGWRTRYNDRMTMAALRSYDKRKARWEAEGVDATKLLADAMELLHGRDMCEGSEEQS